jgi:hypothetical protein
MVEHTDLRPELRGLDSTDKQWIKQEETLAYDIPVFDRGATFYAAATPEEKRLDRRVNRKLDAIVLPLLSIGFLVSRNSSPASVWARLTNNSYLSRSSSSLASTRGT